MIYKVDIKYTQYQHTCTWGTEFESHDVLQAYNYAVKRFWSIFTDSPNLRITQIVLTENN